MNTLNSSSAIRNPWYRDVPAHLKYLSIGLLGIGIGVAAQPEPETILIRDPITTGSVPSNLPRQPVLSFAGDLPYATTIEPPPVVALITPEEQERIPDIAETPAPILAAVEVPEVVVQPKPVSLTPEAPVTPVEVAPSPLPVVPAIPGLDPVQREKFLGMARGALARKDLMQARAFFQYLSARGDAQASQYLGETYEPDNVRRIAPNLVAVQASSETANHYYEQAALQGFQGRTANLFASVGLD